MRLHSSGEQIYILVRVCNLLPLQWHSTDIDLSVELN